MILAHAAAEKNTKNAVEKMLKEGRGTLKGNEILKKGTPKAEERSTPSPLSLSISS